MRFVLGLIPSSGTVSLSNQGWNPLREPSSARFSVQVLCLSLPLLILSMRLQRGLCYVVLEAPLRRDRIILMLIAPFIVLSILLGAVISLRLHPGAWRVCWLSQFIQHFVSAISLRWHAYSSRYHQSLYCGMTVGQRTGNRYCTEKCHHSNDVTGESQSSYWWIANTGNPVITSRWAQITNPPRHSSSERIYSGGFRA